MNISFVSVILLLAGVEIYTLPTAENGTGSEDKVQLESVEVGAEFQSLPAENGISTENKSVEVGAETLSWPATENGFPAEDKARPVEVVGAEIQSLPAGNGISTDDKAAAEIHFRQAPVIGIATEHHKVQPEEVGAKRHPLPAAENGFPVDDKAAAKIEIAIEHKVQPVDKTKNQKHHETKSGAAAVPPAIVNDGLA